MIRIALERQSDLKRFLKHIFESCNLSTENVEKLKTSSKMASNAKYSSDQNAYQQSHGSVYDEYEIYMRNINIAKQARTLR